MQETITEYDVSDGFRIVTVGGEIDIANAGAFEERLVQAAQGATALIVSLAPCTYIDSSGLRILIRMSNELDRAFSVVIPRATQVRRIFDLAGLDMQMTVYESVRDALTGARGVVRAESR